MTADDRPSVTDNARAEAWDEGYQDGLRQGGEGEDGPRYVNPYRAAGRAETTTATDEDAPPVVVQAATVITANTDEPMWSAVVIAKEMASRGLLATARTRPTREDVRSVMWQWFSPDDYRIADKVTDAVLALWADRPTEAEAGARALEEVAALAEHKTHLWLLDLAAELRGGER